MFTSNGICSISLEGADVLISILDSSVSRSSEFHCLSTDLYLFSYGSIVKEDGFKVRVDRRNRSVELIIQGKKGHSCRIFELLDSFLFFITYFEYNKLKNLDRKQPLFKSIGNEESLISFIIQNDSGVIVERWLNSMCFSLTKNGSLLITSRISDSDSSGYAKLSDFSFEFSGNFYRKISIPFSGSRKTNLIKQLPIQYAQESLLC